MNSLAKILARSGLLRDGLDHHLVRASMVLIFVLFGYQKWFEYEAQALIPFMPEGWDIAAGGFPAMTGNVPFLMKDVVLLAASVSLLKQDVAGVVDSRDAGASHAGDRRAVEAVP